MYSSSKNSNGEILAEINYQINLPIYLREAYLLAKDSEAQMVATLLAIAVYVIDIFKSLISIN